LRFTPEGAIARLDTGIGDPNFILVRPDGSFLVSDDATADIYLVQQDGTTELYSTAVNHPNGMVLSQGGATLYVAQTFTNIRPVVFDSSVWKIRLNDEGRPARDARLAVRAGPNAGVDGLAMDANGRIYIAANRAGEIWRYDPATEEMLLITRDIIGVASLAFGEGAFDARSIYATTTRSGGLGGQIWRIPVDAEGARLYR
jgi:sugar lactone lactonase YvrE